MSTAPKRPLTWDEIIAICSKQAAAQINDDTAKQLVGVFTSFRVNQTHGIINEEK